MKSNRIWHGILPLLLSVGMAPGVFGFVPQTRWNWTASGPTGSYGDPITLSWSIVPDGTSLPDEGPSDLIAFLDTTFGSGDGGSDYRQRPWFEIFEQSFDRWSQLCGITYVYEPNDDGRRLSTNAAGVLGKRGDIRISGASIDGDSGTLAYNYYPDHGDMVIDTGDGGFFSVATNNYRRFRNTIMHENGHGLGLDHVESDTSNFLMEPYIATSFDGPQFDDIRGMQWFYGDVHEKENAGAGNDTIATATDLGWIDGGTTLRIGLSASSTSTYVPETAVDFVSIDRNTDIDFFSFTVDMPSFVDLRLIPRGPTYDQGEENGAQSSIDTEAIGDLALALYDSDGFSLLASANTMGVGDAETLYGIPLDDAGAYYVRISATSDDNIQFYRLDIDVEDLVYRAGDFNEDGDVDADDFNIWQLHFGLVDTASHAQGDADADGDVDGTDFLVWQQGSTDAAGGGGASFPMPAVPEPAAALLAFSMFALILRVPVRKADRNIVDKKCGWIFLSSISA